MKIDKTKIAMIPLTNGGFTFVDADRFAELNEFKWHEHSGGYAARWEAHPTAPGKRALIRMHRQVMDLERTDPRRVDHRNERKLDNWRSNLRIATRSQNGANQALPAHNTSGLKGASWHKRSQRWQAQIRVGGRIRYLGRFATAAEAHAAYMEASRAIHGEFHNPCAASTHWSDTPQYKRLGAAYSEGVKRLWKLRRQPVSQENATAVRALAEKLRNIAAERLRFVLSEPIEPHTLSERTKAYITERTGDVLSDAEIAWLEGRASCPGLAHTAA